LSPAELLSQLRLDTGGGNGKNGAGGFPLAGYAARHWVHAQFEKVSSRIRARRDDLFDLSKPHFAAWLRVHDIDERWFHFSPSFTTLRDGSPLYYAAFRSFYDLAERLIGKHPEQVQAVGGRMLAPLLADLRKKHFRVADLLHQHGAAVDIRGFWKDSATHSVDAWTYRYRSVATQSRCGCK